jgi:pimeloyl-ACP methyl ester carboxylesterase
MNRRPLLAAPALIAAGAALRPTLAQGQAGAPALVTEEAMVPATDGQGEIFVRSKRPEGLAPSPNRTLMFVHGATYPAHSTFDLPLAGLSWMDYIAGRGFDVWCMDLRGYGRSTRPAAMAQPPEANPPLMRSDQAVADVAAAAAHIRTTRGVASTALMAWSWGCSLMARFAQDNPTLVNRLVLHAPQWLRDGPSPAGGTPGTPLGAYRTVTQAQARARWTNGVPDAARAALIPPGWFEHWAGVTWASDPEGLRRNPPVLRAPNGVLADSAEYWQAGRPYWDPARITAPTLLVVGEWDRDTPPGMATTLFPLLTASPGKRCVILGEGTHSMMLERSRGALYSAVQVFLEELAA